ncbi:xylitol oxidase [Asanoa ferruginea]|uniref:Xylitol oxidase n=1 Tax=Asanoa ferruginea TaxID=53367 RepID=A0A3D9ZSY8_9ACTN|nr:FAD-binding protein [Asanoa ferruginea]REG00352.1 xylitol oxidase [Asanoa ferruginea]GIF51861.1 xylitol oxidase [Asanoa ferruginea]
MEWNWAGNHRYAAARVARPTSVGEAQDLVASADRVRALGTRHSFSGIADTPGLLLSTADLPVDLAVDEADGSVTVGGGARYGDVAVALDGHGRALATMASLPHISVAGAVATGTHGSGDRTGSLAAGVRAVEVIGPDGTLRTVRRGEPDFAGSVVALGTLGVVTRVTLDTEPSYVVRQAVYRDLPWSLVDTDFDALTGAAYSVSLFVDWAGDRIAQVWLKSRTDLPADLFGVVAADEPVHMLAGAPTAAVTGQQGVSGPWHERLPHFKLAFTPSRGEELQSEYLLPRAAVHEAFAALRPLAPRIASVLQISEIRTVAADDLWLSPAYGTDVVGVHFTWVKDIERVFALLPDIEAALLPLGARPHWGKCFAATEVAASYPRMADFRALRARVDPTGKFGNDLVDTLLG